LIDTDAGSELFGFEANNITSYWSIRNLIGRCHAHPMFKKGLSPIVQPEAVTYKHKSYGVRAPNGNTHKIEFLGDGQQAVLYGYHADAKRNYSWHAGRDPLTVPPAQWPEISEVEADGLLEALDELLTAQFDYKRAGDDERRARGNGIQAAYHVVDVAAALSDFSYCGKGGGGNIHDVELGCINRLIIGGNSTEAATSQHCAPTPRPIRCAPSGTGPKSDAR
jgi:hypothetical protein